MTDHAKFAPSSMARLVSCPGSLNLIARARDAGIALPDGETDSSEEGTAAHWVASELLQGRIVEPGQLAPNGVPVDDDMQDGAILWCEALGQYRHVDECIEERIEIPRVHPECWGTPDYFCATTPGRIVVADYKYGHRFVDAFENWQLLAYAAGSVEGIWPSVTYALMIVQPRSFHRSGQVRTWTLSGDDLSHYCAVMATATRKAGSKDAECRVGPHCYKCPARHVCEAALHAEDAALELAGDSVPLILSNDAKSARLRRVRRAMKHLTEMESGLSEDIAQTIRNGESVPGWGLEAGAGRERWAKPLDEVLALGAAFGIDISKPGALTPNQARKAGLPAEVVAGYSERPAGEVKLVEVDARRMFKS